MGQILDKGLGFAFHPRYSIKASAFSRDHLCEIWVVGFCIRPLCFINLNSAHFQVVPIIFSKIPSDLVSPSDSRMTFCHHFNTLARCTDRSQLSWEDGSDAIDGINLLS